MHTYKTTPRAGAHDNNLYTVGYVEDGKWYPLSDHTVERDAQERVAELNGREKRREARKNDNQEQRREEQWEQMTLESANCRVVVRWQGDAREAGDIVQSALEERQLEKEPDEHRGAWKDVSKDGREVYTWEEYEVVKEPGESFYTAIYAGGWPLTGVFYNAVDAQEACEKDSPFTGAEPPLTFEHIQEPQHDMEIER